MTDKILGKKKNRRWGSLTDEITGKNCDGRLITPFPLPTPLLLLSVLSLVMSSLFGLLVVRVGSTLYPSESVSQSVSQNGLSFGSKNEEHKDSFFKSGDHPGGVLSLEMC